MSVAQAAQTCKNHGKPVRDYGHRKNWCRQCMADYLKNLTTIRTCLTFFEYGIVFACILLAVGVCPYAPREEGKDLPRAFYLFLMVPISFISACVSTLLVRTVIWLLDKLAGGAIALSRWFSPTRMLRDWIRIAIAFTGLYWLTVWGLDKFMPGHSADTQREWLTLRAPLLIVLSALVLWLADIWGLITTGAVIPRHGWRLFFVLCYSVAITYSWLWFQYYLSQFATENNGKLYVEVALGSLAVSLLMYGITLAAAYIIADGLKRDPDGPNTEIGKEPVPATLAIVGPSNTGKSVFLVRAYELLRGFNKLNLVGIRPTAESEAALKIKRDTLEEDRDWFGGDIHANEIPFELRYGIRKIVKFNWLDLPGGAFNKPEDWVDERATFDAHLGVADAVAMLIDGRDLENIKNFSELWYGKMYKDIADQLYERLDEMGEGARPVPLAIIITQYCRVNPKNRRKLTRLVQPLARYWEDLAKSVQLPRPNIRVFLTSAVLLDYDPNSNELPQQPEPLRSENCIEPVFWLAAEVMRANAELLDFTAGVVKNSPFQEAVAALESGIS